MKKKSIYLFPFLLFGFLQLLNVLPAQAQVQIDSISLISPEIPAEDTDIVHEKQEVLFAEQHTKDTLLFTERHFPADRIRQLKANDNFWYADSAFNQKAVISKGTTNDYVPVSQRSWFQTALWILILVVFAGALIYYLAGNQVGLFRKKHKIEEGEDNLNDELPENIFEINYQREIDKAAGDGNYRLAVRLMFLRLLRKLAEKNLIQYKQDKTNLDYLLQLSRANYYKQFFRVTRHYEYAWYGLFELLPSAYERVRSDFETLQNELDRY